MTEICEITGCEEESIKSIPRRTFEKYISDLKLKKTDVRRIHICKKHYKEYKKKTKKDREFDRLGWR